jgi:plasmid stability protein
VDEIRFTVRLPRRMYEALQREAARRGESMTTVLRAILRDGLGK